MTEAQLVWNIWRRILTEDALADAVLVPELLDRAAGDLGADERAIVADYARTPLATETTIGAYRRGLVRNALNSLKLVPLSHRLLHASGVDVPAVTADFVRAIHYRDDGPYFWRTAADFVGYLAGLPAFANPAQQDALALEAAAIALVRRLGEMRPPKWPQDAALDSVRHGDRYVTNRAAATVSTGHDLTPWLEDSLDFAPDAALERSACHWLVYVPVSDAGPNYAELSERAFCAFNLMSTPKTAAELSAGLGGLAIEEVFDVLGSLAEIGAIVRREEA
jgi:hypothetical protein